MDSLRHLSIAALVLLTLGAPLSAESIQFFGSGALKLGYGQQQSIDGASVPSHSLGTYALDGMLGASWKFLIVGLAGEYSMSRQWTNPATVSGSNTQGKLWDVSPAFGLKLGNVRILARLPRVLFGQYNLDTKDASGNAVAYSSADQWNFQVHYQPSNHLFFGAEFQQLTFQQMNVGGTVTNLVGTDQFRTQSYSLLAGFAF